MTLSEIYFFIIIILYLFSAMIIISFTEDLKDDRYFKLYLKYSLILGCLGIIMELFGWNHFCRYNCIISTFTPFFTVLIVKGISIFFKKVLNKEGFQMFRGELSDGIWSKNKGSLDDKKFNGIYSVCLFFFPVFFVTITFSIIRNYFCY